MDATNWLKQGTEPLFPDLLWSRPENRRSRGKLLIVGGNTHGFAAPAASFAAAGKAGIGSSRVLLPQALQRTLGKSFAEADFVPSTPSGSFAKSALDSLLDNATWADGVLLAGDFGRNSETAILLSSFLDKYSGQVTVAQDGLDYFLGANGPLFNHPRTLAVINMGKLQKLAKNNRPNPPIRHAMSLHELVSVLNAWGIPIITKHADNLIVSAEGKSSTSPDSTDNNWQVDLAAYASVWLLQNPEKTLEALSTAVFQYVNDKIGGRGET